jgi:tetratricopeptide (TPR) repeat protein
LIRRGQAQGQMHFPFDDWELENKLLALENALLRFGGSQRSISPEERTVQEFGERLFKAVLTGDIRTSYEVSLRVAREQNKGLRLKLHIQPPKLALLPWEFLYDPDSGEYLCFSSSTPLVRYVDLSRPIEQLPVTPPLRILGMVASPTDLPQLDVEHEKRLVEEVLKVLQAKGLVELTWLEEQTWNALQEAMWGGPWHIFHFVGHGDFDPNSGEGRVAFSNETTGHQEVLAARHLARLLDDHHELRLAFLNSCEGAKGSEGDPFSGTAATLVRRGVPAVLAMQYQITDSAAIAFSRAFYHAVAHGLPVDAAVAAARTAVSINDTLEWGTPVLYMRSPDGRLFDIKKEEMVEKESFRRYREYVQTSWTRGELREKEAEGLKEFANELKLPPSSAADIEREVMGETKEDILERREQAVKENYRKAVEAAWTGHDLSNAEVEQLHVLSTELDLSPNTAADIERKVMDDTVQAIVQRQSGEEERRQRHLKELYDRARRSHQNQEWQAVVDVFERIYSEDPNYPDPEGLLASSRDALEREQRAAALYDRGQRHMEAEEWQQALECFEEIQQLVPGYRESRELLARVRQELTTPPKVEVPDVRGQTLSQAHSSLASKGLELSVYEEVSSDTIAEGEIIEQSPVPETEVLAGSSVSVTLRIAAAFLVFRPIETALERALSK